MKKIVSSLTLSIGLLGLITLPFKSSLSNSLISISIGNLISGAILTRFYESKINLITQKNLDKIRLEGEKIELELRLNESKKLLNQTLKQLETVENSNNLVLKLWFQNVNENVSKLYQNVNNLIPYLAKKHKLNLSLDEFHNSYHHFKSTLNRFENGLDLNDLLKFLVDFTLDVSKIQTGTYKKIVEKYEKTSVSVEVFNNLKLNLESVKSEFYGVTNELIKLYDSDFKEVVLAGKKQESVVVELEKNLKLALVPLHFTGISESSNVGNNLIDYFFKFGYRLDAIESNETELGYSLEFSTVNNSKFLNAKKLNENEIEFKIQLLSNSLNTPKFLDRPNGRVVLEIQKRQPIKKLKDFSEISRLFTSYNQFGERIWFYHNQKPTIRVCGSTGSGKGVFLKNYINFLTTQPIQIGLLDPVSGSTQDYWGCEKMGFDTQSSIESFERFYAEFYNRKEKISINKNPWLLIIDEVDKTFDKDLKLKISQIWTEIRHYGFKMVLSGQSSEVGKNGWRWDELHNCVQIFIGSGILTLTKHAKDVGLSDKSCKTILENYNTITEYFNELNKNIPVQNHHRISLVVLDGKYEFLEIPPALTNPLKSGKGLIVTRFN
jgi:hypothetical protein